jgi:hypothetical protein
MHGLPGKAGFHQEVRGDGAPVSGALKEGRRGGGEEGGREGEKATKLCGECESDLECRMGRRCTSPFCGCDFGREGGREGTRALREE